MQVPSSADALNDQDKMGKTANESSNRQAFYLGKDKEKEKRKKLISPMVTSSIETGSSEEPAASNNKESS